MGTVKPAACMLKLAANTLKLVASITKRATCRHYRSKDLACERVIFFAATPV